MRGRLVRFARLLLLVSGSLAAGCATTSATNTPPHVQSAAEKQRTKEEYDRAYAQNSLNAANAGILAASLNP
jgi:hypothetical protein